MARYLLSAQPWLVEAFLCGSVGRRCKSSHFPSEHWMRSAHSARKLSSEEQRNPIKFLYNTCVDSTLWIAGFVCDLHIHGSYGVTDELEHWWVAFERTWPRIYRVSSYLINYAIFESTLSSFLFGHDLLRYNVQSNSIFLDSFKRLNMNSVVTIFVDVQVLIHNSLRLTL